MYVLNQQNNAINNMYFCKNAYFCKYSLILVLTKNIGESAEQKSGLSFAVRQAQV